MVTLFQSKVYHLTKKIPKGKVTTYKRIAKKLRTNAYRAVGSALRHNEHIKIPCHRVVNSGGSVGGYSGVKNSKKKIQLLKKEGIEIKNNKIENFKKVLFRF